MTYERKFHKFLTKSLERGLLHGKLFSHHWIHFEDDNGPGWAQPDFFIVQENQVVVFETKLTQNDGAWEQLRGLYTPLLAYLFRRSCCCLQVCKHLIEDDGTLIGELGLLEDGKTFHWLGH